MRAIIGIVLVLAGCISGCDGAKTRWQESRRSPQQWLDVALESRQADERRKAVDALASGRAATEEWAVKAFDSIARTDVDSMVRVAALRGLRRSMSAATVPTLVKLLTPGTPPADARPAPGPVRWEAMQLLRDIGRDGNVPADRQSAVAEVLVQRAERDPDRNVRIAAVEAMGDYRETRVTQALLAALKDRDFAMQSAAEGSLRRITGESHAYDAEEWSTALSKSPAQSQGPATKHADASMQLQ